MKYAVMDRGDDLSIELSDTFRRKAGEIGMILDEDNPDLVLSIGGDGTMLHAFHKYADKLKSISFIGIHTGHLGFYADWKAKEIGDLLRLLQTMNELGAEKRTVQYPLVQVDICRDGEISTYLALNECTVRGLEATMVAELRMNDEQFEMFRGDGICVSTPSGSTAYNKSLGGALIHPTLEAIQIAEIASINNRVYRTLGSPIIMPKHHHCDIYPRANRKLFFTIDHMQFHLDRIESIRCKVADVKVRFARLRPFPFWNRVREAFIGRELT